MRRTIILKVSADHYNELANCGLQTLFSYAVGKQMIIERVLAPGDDADVTIEIGLNEEITE